MTLSSSSSSISQLWDLIESLNFRKDLPTTTATITSTTTPTLTTNTTITATPTNTTIYILVRFPWTVELVLFLFYCVSLRDGLRHVLCM